MNKLRHAQAQELILKSVKKQKGVLKLKEAEEGTIDVSLHETALKNLIKSEEFIYNSLPHHNLSKEEATEYTKYLITIRDSINSQLANFKVIEEEVEEVDVNELTSEILFITTKNNFKKVLKKLGIDVQRIIVADMPLVLEDMKKINPKIPDAALKGIGTKIEHIHNDIKRKIESLSPKKIIVLGEKDINGKLLSQRAEEQYEAKSCLVDNLKEITEIELKKIIEN